MKMGGLGIILPKKNAAIVFKRIICKASWRQPAAVLVLRSRVQQRIFKSHNSRDDVRVVFVLSLPSSSRRRDDDKGQMELP